jgi:hypothetical protein
MKTYFEYKGYKVVDCKDKEFANFEVQGTNRCFNELPDAICYAIAVAESNGKISENNLMAYVDTFITMINKEQTR